MIRIIIIILIVFVLTFILFTFIKSFRSAFIKHDFISEENNDQNNPSRIKYSSSAHQEEVSKMEAKIKNLQKAINKK